LLFEKKTIFENFTISENNIINGESAKVVLAGIASWKIEHQTPNT
jgi:hypothetical protein